MDFSYYSLPPIATTIISLFIGIYILKRNPKNELNRIWFLFLFTIVLWSSGEAGIRLAGKNINNALIWHNVLLLAGGGFIAGVFVHFSLIFPVRHKLRDNKFLLPFIYSVTSGFYLYALVKGWDVDTSKLNEIAGSYTRESLTRVVADNTYLISMFWIAALILFGILILIQNFFKLQNTYQKSQIGIIIFGTIFFFGAGFFTDVILPNFGIVTIELASVGALATSATVAYVILKTKLIDIELISEKIEMGKLDEKIEKYPLLKGYTYLIPEERVDLSFKLFAREVSKGAHGLILTSTNPLEVREKYKFRKIPIIWIVDDLSSSEANSTDPNVIIAAKEDTSRIQDLMKQFMIKSTNNIIFLEDLNNIYGSNTQSNQRQILLNTSRTTFDLIKDYHSRFIISLNPKSLNISDKRHIIRTKSPILEMRLLTIFILEEVSQQVIDALEVRVGRESINKKLHWLKSADPFFLKLKFQDGKIFYGAKTIVYREDLVKKIKLFINTIRSLDRTLDLDSIALRILMKYGFSEYEYYIQTGNTYIVKDKTGSTAFDMFQKFIDSGFEGLCISKTNPKKILERYGLTSNPENTFWLTDISSKTENVIPPKLEHISMEIENFMDKTKSKKIIILDGVEYLISYSGDIFNTVLGFLRKISDRISESDTVLIIPLNFETLDSQRISLITRSGIEIFNKGYK